MIRNLATGRKSVARWLLSAAFLAALVTASPAHAHSTATSEAACTVCTFSHQTPSLQTVVPLAERPPGLETQVAPVQESDSSVGDESPSRPRSPPLFS